MKKKVEEKKVAIVIDVLLENGGAVRVLRSLLSVYPSAEIFTSVYNLSLFSWIQENHVRTSFIQKLPLHDFWTRHYVLLSPIAFEQFSFNEYELVISLSAGCAKGVITTTETKHIGIILTPPRYQWDGRITGTIPILANLSDSYLRVWDYEAALRPDVLVSISKFIQRKVKKIYRRDSTVIYPGIDTTFWTVQKKQKRKEYYLVVSRLRDYKRIDIAIEACESAGKDLIVIGDGPESTKLHEIAGKHTRFLGFVPDSEVRNYMRECKAFLFPGTEDFGLAPLEAMACGAPIVAYNDGGFPETMVDGMTGILCAEQTKECFIEGIKSVESRSWDADKISQRAQVFSESAFLSNLQELIDEETKS